MSLNSSKNCSPLDESLDKFADSIGLLELNPEGQQKLAHEEADSSRINDEPEQRIIEEIPNDDDNGEDINDRVVIAADNNENPPLIEIE